MPSGGAYTVRIEALPWVVPYVALMNRLGMVSTRRPRCMQAVVDFVASEGTRVIR